MRYGVDVSYSLKQWKNAINNKFRENNRYLDDDMESEFWHNYFKKDIPINNDYAKEIIRDLKLILAGYNLKNGLELGPGWGNYTYFLADNLEELEIVDISSDSLEFIKSRAEEKSIENIKYHNSSFKNFDFKEYDLIFGFNCFYRELDIEKLLLNTNNSARKLAILGLMTSYEPEFNYEIKSKFNYELDGMTNDYILLTNILYSL